LRIIDAGGKASTGCHLKIRATRTILPMHPTAEKHIKKHPWPLDTKFDPSPRAGVRLSEIAPASYVTTHFIFASQHWLIERVERRATPFTKEEEGMEKGEHRYYVELGARWRDGVEPGQESESGM